MNWPLTRFIVLTTTWVVPQTNVSQATCELAVKQRIQEAKRFLSIGKAKVVQERDDRGERWCRGGRAINRTSPASNYNEVI